MRYFLLLIFCFIGKSVIAQSYYFPEGQAIWVESYWIDNPDLLGFERTEGSNAYILDRDTILDGKLYRNLSFWKVSYYYRKFSYLVDTVYQNEKIADAGAVRATEDGKVYYRHYGNIDIRSVLTWVNYPNVITIPANIDLLFYNFALMPSDTFTHPIYSVNGDYTEGMVDSVSYIEVAGINRKVIWLNKNRYPQDIWVEGIGSLNGFFSASVNTTFEYGGGYLTCFEENGIGSIQRNGQTFREPVFELGASCQNFLTNLPIVQYSPPNLKLYPIPTTNWLRVEYPFIPNIKSIQIVNFLGQQMAASYQSFGEEMLQINTSNLVPGSYIFVLKTDSQIITAKFFK